MGRVLGAGGVWALGDLVFENERAEREALSRFGWLEAEQFARIDELRLQFSKLNMRLQCQQFTPVTWVLWSSKPVH